MLYCVFHADLGLFLCLTFQGWSEVRDDCNPIDWIIVGYEGSSKSDINVLLKGSGGLEECSSNLPRQKAVFGGVRLSSGRFVTFFYASEGTSIMQKGRASMHKNGVFNVLEGSDCEIEIEPQLNEDEVVLPVISNGVSGDKVHSKATKNKNSLRAQVDVGNGCDHEPIMTEESTMTKERHYDEEPLAHEKIESTGDSEVDEQNTNDLSPIADSENSVNVPYSILKGIGNISLLPEGVDPLKREMSLSVEEFEEVFGMNKETFYRQPAWKQTNQKKKALLF